MARTKINGARDVALEILTRVDEHQSYSNLELKNVLSSHQLSPQDTGLVTELVYGTIQRRLTLDTVITRFVKGGTKKLQPWVLNLLRMSLYQVRYLDRVPDRAAVHEAVEIAKRKGHQGISSLVNGVLRNVLRQPETWTTAPKGSVAEQIAYEESHPIWLVKRWLKLYGEEATRAICQTNNLPPHTSVRVNRLKIAQEDLLAHLKRDLPEVAVSTLSPDGLVVSGHAAGTSWFQDGFMTIQDESSMLVAPALHVKPGMRVLDACAAPGGKTTHLAEMMDNQGEIVACDVHPHKRELIGQTAKRLGITIVKTLVSDAADLPNQEIGLFDRILLDAPCTGLGVIRRKPDIKWNKTEQDIKDIAKVQFELITQVSKLLKPGGLLVYSTCTMEPEENQHLVGRFLQENPDYEWDLSLTQDLPPAVQKLADGQQGFIQILPHQFSSDGFFISRIRRKEA
ncbi:16S rRNA (cytosine(967)-C(5))-methyltransferase RsmB [Brevibacillus sp. SYSU BS000544]|uniref:16S rRNA (cytosine(967)-C(5))-methyltransferase RsmB n=1 Tax=Brevibacillus sp. SYSU BS000544 TaxID=3416443 RepID=UPI003CE58D49